MIKSMTGFGRGDSLESGYKFNVEIKTINHRYIDFFTRLPRHLSYLEDRVKKYIQGFISRGRVEVYISLEYIDRSDIEVEVNLPLAIGYYNAISKVAEATNTINNTSPLDIARFPDVIKTTKLEENEDIVWNVLKSAMDTAISNLSIMRLEEGEKLFKDIIDRLRSIEELLSEIQKYAPKVVEDYKTKLMTRIKEWEKENIIVEESRILTEVSMYADRSNIDEELVRLKSHIHQFIETLKSQDPVGRKLDFIIQEMNRETNTIGSKANFLEITRNVVEIKSEIEKIREQIQNIE